MRNSQFARVFVYTAVAALTAVFLWGFVNRYLPVDRAAGGPNGATITFDPGSGDKPTDESHTMRLSMIPNTATQKFSAFDLRLQTTGNLEIISISKPLNISADEELFHTVLPQSARLAYTVGINAEPVSQVQFDVTFKGKAAGAGGLTVDTANSEVVGTVEGYVFSLDNVTNAEFNFVNGIGEPPTNAPEPTKPPGGGGEQCTAENSLTYFTRPGVTATYANGKVTFGGAEGKIVMYQANLPFWGSEWRATAEPVVTNGNTAAVPEGFFQADFITPEAKVIPSPEYNGETYSGNGVLLGAINGNNKCESNPPEPTTPPGGGNEPTNAPEPTKPPGGGNEPTNVPVPTTPPGGGGGGSLACGISCQKDSDCASGFCNPAGFPLCPTSAPGQPLEGCQLIPPDPTQISVCAPVTCRNDNTNPANCACTNEPTGGGAPVEMTLNLKMKFQGIQKKPTVGDGDVVQVRLVGPSRVAMSASFTPDNEGNYNGTVSGSAKPGKYYVLVKGPRHIQKKICTPQPSESTPGTYRCGAGQIELKAGANTLDFSQITLAVGDLPQQDGVIDSYDFSYLRQTLGSTKPSDLRVGDLNRDGIIDTQDISLILQSLAIKYDQE